MTDSNAAGFSSLSATDLQELAVLLRKLIMEPSRIGEAENVTISSQAATRRRTPRPGAAERFDIARFDRLEQSLMNLDLELMNLANTVRQLRSSIKLVISSNHVRADLAIIRDHFRLNAMRQVKSKTLLKTPLPMYRAHDPSVKLEGFAEALTALSESLLRLGESVSHFSNLNEGLVNTSLDVLSQQLRSWSSTLDSVEENSYFGIDELQDLEIYLDDLSPMLSRHVEALSDSLRQWIQGGVPPLSNRQDRAVAVQQNLSTIAIFFSGVSATTIQYSYGIVQSQLSLATNLLWLLSLVLSISSAINSQFAIYWWSSPFQSSVSQSSPFPSFITRSPMVLLACSSIAFLMGLVCFTFEVFQTRHFIVPIVLTMFIVTLSSYLIATGLWQLAEWNSVRRFRPGTRSPPAPGPDGHRIIKSAFVHLREFGSRIIRGIRIGGAKLHRHLLPRARLYTSPAPLHIPLHFVSRTPSNLPPIGNLPANSSSSKLASGLASEIPSPYLVDDDLWGTIATQAVRSQVNGPLPSPTRSDPLTEAFQGLCPSGQLSHEALTAILPSSNSQFSIKALSFGPMANLLAVSTATHLVIWGIEPYRVLKLLSLDDTQRNYLGYAISWSSSESNLVLWRSALDGSHLTFWDLNMDCVHPLVHSNLSFAICMPSTQGALVIQYESQLAVTRPFSKDQVVVDVRSHDLRLISAAIAEDEQRVVAVATHVSSALATREGTRTNWARSVDSRLLIIEFETRTILRQIPLLSSPKSISFDRNLILVSFRSEAPSRLYYIADRQAAVSFARELPRPAQQHPAGFGEKFLSIRRWRPSHVVVGDFSADQIAIYESWSGDLLHAIPVSRLSANEFDVTGTWTDFRDTGSLRIMVAVATGGGIVTLWSSEVSVDRDSNGRSLFWAWPQSEGKCRRCVSLSSNPPISRPLSRRASLSHIPATSLPSVLAQRKGALAHRPPTEPVDPPGM